jgi:hypothetical protein
VCGGGGGGEEQHCAEEWREHEHAHGAQVVSEVMVVLRGDEGAEQCVEHAVSV